MVNRETINSYPVLKYKPEILLTDRWSVLDHLLTKMAFLIFYVVKQRSLIRLVVGI